MSTPQQAYNERCDELLVALMDMASPATCGDLANALSWEPSEIRAKLMSLRADGLATYDAAATTWEANRA